ncbi:MAG: CaCA family Na(+)/Ca(+) antiporter, inner membrane protein [Candidatus Peregrinibacteria bacterium GW2011_GWF2_38_29]|nr:MAG: CaCA family Na(+)/Ca(+) antiporter, inner membrane protein [Candidatus Peregrinibacteria bacterium GW2011_GWF2_38_29]HBB02447.1 sodium:proton exchanger [Candidatus Peregrinibacteria bacterium]
MYIVFLILGFVFLLKGADFLIKGASSIARRLNISDLVIGLTIVAFGTSAPELLVNIDASILGRSDIVLGNILGSNIANILLILGVASIISPLVIRSRTVLVEIPLGIFAIIVLGILGNDIFINKSLNSFISKTDGIIMIFFFMIFLVYAYKIAKTEIFRDGEEQNISLLKSIIYLIIGIVALPLGGKWVVESAVEIATLIGLSQFVIAATIVAIGTSLPELVTSTVAAYQKKPDIAVGNVVGSNIFNVFWILGISAVIKPIPINSINNWDILIAGLIGVFMFLFLHARKRFFVQTEYVLSRWSGIIFLVFYFGYVVFLILRGTV